jgi:hypothetical protein
MSSWVLEAEKGHKYVCPGGGGVSGYGVTVVGCNLH